MSMFPNIINDKNLEYLAPGPVILLKIYWPQVNMGKSKALPVIFFYTLIYSSLKDCAAFFSLSNPSVTFVSFDIMKIIKIFQTCPNQEKKYHLEGYCRIL